MCAKTKHAQCKLPTSENITSAIFCRLHGKHYLRIEHRFKGGGDPRTIWGSNDESLEENNVIDGDYEPSGLESDEGESFDANPQIPENYAKVTQ